ncbi:MAG: hypothetical protein M1546_25865 [Chloroflexi bacterium]|nr:hypothetical protein [Chloroflexota bacterium]
MSKNMYQTMDRFRIEHIHFSQVLQAIKQWASQRPAIHDGINCADILAADDVWTALQACRWSVDTENGRDITCIEFLGGEEASDEALFNAIARYVKDGSYIQMFDEACHIWRWRFEDGQLLRQDGAVIIE